MINREFVDRSISLNCWRKFINTLALGFLQPLLKNKLDNLAHHFNMYIHLKMCHHCKSLLDAVSTTEILEFDAVELGFVIKNKFAELQNEK